MKAGTCRHFTGILNKTCDAGIEYASVRDPDVRPARLACLGSPACIAKCEKFDATTALEEAEFLAAMHRSFEQTMVARKAIEEHLGPFKKGTSAQGSIPCPCCSIGSLNFSRAGYNGHIHAACTHPSCVRWME